MKLALNPVPGLNRAAPAAGLHDAACCGVEPASALEILKAGPAYSRAMEVKGAKMLSGGFAPEARLAQHLKDVHLILATGEARGCRAVGGPPRPAGGGGRGRHRGSWTTARS
jgi:3-hydroxyisobutyrate dehydrogenase-like beta-hydroxyacid dehydrogenase